MTKKSALPSDTMIKEDAPDKIARRTFLEGTAGLIACAGIAAGSLQNAKAADKAAQADVDYQDTPKDGLDCAGCRFFVSDGACEIVEGKISPDGWCAVWAPV